MGDRVALTMSQIRAHRNYRIVFEFFANEAPMLGPFVAFVVYTKVFRHPLTATSAFISMNM